MVEIDDRRGPGAVAAARGVGLVDVHTVADLTGRDRVVVARRATVDPRSEAATP